MTSMTRFIFILLAALIGPSGCAGNNRTAVASAPLKDGVYTAATAPDGERYFCKGTMKIENGKIVSLEWEIRDKNRHDRLFDETYGPAVYTDSALYLTQCRENLAGMKTYAPGLIAKQDLAGVDAVTGATWAYGKFSELMRELLGQARR
jgi:major membrane immunogen (membrane-anchored lipoprotein)